jgi:hypothetical protein
MIELKCPKCRSELEIEDKEVEKDKKTAVFCKKESCFFYKNPLIGLERQDSKIYISESIV